MPLFDLSSDDLQKLYETLKGLQTKEFVIEQAVQGDGPIPQQLDIFKNDMDYGCERLILRWEVREKLMIDTETGELV